MNGKNRRLRLVPDLIIMTEFSPELFGNGMSLLKGKRIFNYMGMFARVQLPIKKRQFMDFLPISLDNSPVFTCWVRFFFFPAKKVLFVLLGGINFRYRFSKNVRDIRGGNMENM